MNANELPCTVPEHAVPHWHETIDMLVIGYGCAGAATAIGAADAGGEVMVLERASAGGGSSALSGAVIYCGGGTAIQRACGFEDSVDDMFNYLCASTGVAPDRDKIRHYCEGSVTHFEWLASLGIPFKHSYWPHNAEPHTDDCLYFSGGERTSPFNRLARPAPRGHTVQSEGSCTGGRVLMQHLDQAVRDRGVQVTCDARALALIISEDGRAAGVVARINGEIRYLRARAGVALCSGGFIHNRDMVARYAPQALPLQPLGAAWDDGSGIQMAQAAGADCINMHAVIYACPILTPPQFIQGILVNRRGQRFINEDLNHKSIGEQSVVHQGGQVYLLVDNAIFAEPAFPTIQLVASGDSIAEVEDEMQWPEGSLQNTVALYNTFAAQGLDPLFGKHADYVRPLSEPPFGLFDCSIAAGAPYLTFTLGGLRTTTDGQVLSLAGRPIAGLYAAGRTTSGLSAQLGVNSGLQIGEGTFFGRRAGSHALANTPMKPR